MRWFSRVEAMVPLSVVVNCTVSAVTVTCWVTSPAVRLALITAF